MESNILILSWCLYLRSSNEYKWLQELPLLPYQDQLDLNVFLQYVLDIYCSIRLDLLNWFKKEIYIADRWHQIFCLYPQLVASPKYQRSPKRQTVLVQPPLINAETYNQISDFMSPYLRWFYCIRHVTAHQEGPARECHHSVKPLYTYGHHGGRELCNVVCRSSISQESWWGI